MKRFLILTGLVAIVLASASWKFFKNQKLQDTPAVSPHPVISQDQTAAPGAVPVGYTELQANEWFNQKISHGDADTFDILVSVIHDKRYSEKMRNYAVQQVSCLYERTTDIRIIPVLVEAAHPSSDNCVRDVAIYTLGRLSKTSSDSEYLSQEAIEAIRSGIGKENIPSVRIAAIRSVAFMSSKPCLDRVEEVASEVDAPKAVRVAAFDVLGLCHDLNLQNIIAKQVKSLSQLPESDPLIMACRRAQARIGVNVVYER